MKMMKKLMAFCLSTAVISGTSIAFLSNDNEVLAASATTGSVTQNETYKKPKYIFTFIGDGMSYVQLNAASIYKGVTEQGGLSLGELVTSEFPVVGSATTQDATSFCPDSASTATAISSGVKTHSGVIGYEADKVTKTENIAEMLKDEGYKVGVVSSVSIDHATPAAFYAHAVSRGDMYDIAIQLGESGFDYFAGGSLAQPTGKNGDMPNAFDSIKANGYTIVDTKEMIMSLDSSDEKVYVINPELQDSQAMNYAIDADADEVQLKDLVQKGIDVLDNDDEGFFMAVESGKIDWAGHANDAKANIGDVLAFDEAIQVAVDFAKEHPEETLILVTGDHETGGMTIGHATTGYNTSFEILEQQKMSFVEFDTILDTYRTAHPNATLEDFMPIIEQNFGLVHKSNEAQAAHPQLVLSDYEYNQLEKAFDQMMKPKTEREKTQESKLIYGGYEPITVTLTHTLNNKAGIGWTSYSHTGVPVPVYAMGVGQELFNGSYENTEIFHKLVGLVGLKSRMR